MIWTHFNMHVTLCGIFYSFSTLLKILFTDEIFLKTKKIKINEFYSLYRFKLKATVTLIALEAADPKKCCTLN